MSAIKDLDNLLATLVDERRKLVSELTKLGAREQGEIDLLVDMQRRIEAVKSAIEDETSRAASTYENPATTV